MSRCCSYGIYHAIDIIVHSHNPSGKCEKEKKRRYKERECIVDRPHIMYGTRMSRNLKKMAGCGVGLAIQYILAGGEEANA